MQNEILLINMFLSMIRNLIPPKVYDVIKAATAKALEMPDRGDGARTAFIIAEASKAAAATPSQTDDFWIMLATYLYLRKAQKRTSKPAL